MRAQHLRRAEDIDTPHSRTRAILRLIEGDGAPLARRGERNLAHERARLLRTGRDDRLSGLVRTGRARRHHAEDAPQVRLIARERLHAVHLKAVGRQRAGLVHAEHIHVAQRLDGIGLLHQRAEADDAHGANGVGDRDREEEAVRHEAGDDRRVLHALREVDALEEGVHHHQQLEVDDDEQHDANDQIDLSLQRRQHAAEGARAGGDLVRQALRPHLLGHIVRRAADAEAARIDGIALLLLDQDSTRRSTATHPPTCAHRRRPCHLPRSGRPAPL